MDLDEAAKAFRELVSVVKALRTPGTGCPWDLEQDHRTLRQYLVEETYEVLDAIDHNDDRAFREELGDLLLQVVLHAQLADDRGAFSITEVVRGITEKMVRRHPHVFGSAQVSGSAEVLRNWEQIKAAEKEAHGRPADTLAGIPESLPALLRAQRIGGKAAKAGLDPGTSASILEAHSGLAALEATQGSTNPEEREQLEHSLGEVLFGLCQLARRLGLDAEASLRACTGRFVDRFRRAEQRAPDRSSR